MTMHTHIYREIQRWRQRDRFRSHFGSRLFSIAMPKRSWPRKKWICPQCDQPCPTHNWCFYCGETTCWELCGEDTKPRPRPPPYPPPASSAVTEESNSQVPIRTPGSHLQTCPVLGLIQELLREHTVRVLAGVEAQASAVAEESNRPGDAIRTGWPSPSEMTWSNGTKNSIMVCDMPVSISPPSSNH